ncbi:MAG: sulfur carrier protein ThiS [Fibrobacterota bacterium]|nr:sulfur carrier protein ThiS [Fibrobacterota bacterium]QQS05005.1 MAG: sulfur carrier protein ThiS [Fibrobacterota bacterium]
MVVHVNGEDRTVESATDVLGLVTSLGLEPGWVVVEHNLHALDRALWSSTPLADGDQVEIVRFMGGG